MFVKKEVEIVNENRLARLRSIYGWVLSLSLLLAGICLMAACLGIYRSGDDAFSRQAVARAFGPIAIPVCLCLILTLGGAVLACLTPAPRPPAASGLSPTVRRQRLRYGAALDEEGVSRGQLPPQVEPIMVREAVLRTRCRRIPVIALVLGSGLFLCYALNGSHFHQTDINSSMIRASALLMACLLPAFCLGVLCRRLIAASTLREIAALQAAGIRPRPLPVKPARSTRTATALLLVAAVGLILFGHLAGGWSDVLTKAVNICTECIGLG